MSASALQAKIEASNTAAGNGDYATAILCLRQAKALLIGMPNAAHGGDSMQWDRTAIDSLIREYQSAMAVASANASGGIVVTKVRYKEPCEE